MQESRQLILSSSSPARRALLTRLQIPFISTSPDIDETPLANESVEEMVERLAIAKAKKTAAVYPNALIIGCDQVGTLNNQMLAKPLTIANAIQQLEFMSGKKVRFFTAMCLLDTKHDQLQFAIETYDVYFRKLNKDMINNYLKKEAALQCAGSCQIEGLGITLIEKLDGNDYTALIGLPLIRLTDMLTKAGMQIP